MKCTSGMAGAVWYRGPPVPLCALTGHAELLAHGPERVVVRVVERLDPVARDGWRADEHATAQAVLACTTVTSSMASSTSLRKIWPMPARASGFSAPKSTIQRLCAWTPGEAVLVLVGGRRLARTARSSGRTAARCWGRSPRRRRRRRSAALRRSPSQLRTRRSVSFRSLNGFLYFSRQASKSSRYFGSRNSRYCAWLPPAWVSAEMTM